MPFLMAYITIDPTNIGIVSHENIHQSPRDLLSLLTDKKCDVIICTSIDRKTIDRSISSYIMQGLYQSNYLQSIWSPVIPVNLLLDYEISKLIEIINLHVEAKNSAQQMFGTGLKGDKTTNLVM